MLFSLMEPSFRCRVCGHGHTKPFFDLGAQPLANSLLKSSRDQERFYPLCLNWCPQCSLAQLNYTVSPKRLFSTYVWVTGTSRTAREFAETFARKLIRRTSRPRTGYVLELASNDGTFLKPFLKKKFSVLGIDPAANIVAMAKKEGVPTECAFWRVRTAKNIVRTHGKARMVFARNVLAHVKDPRDFVRGIVHVLHDEGTAAIEVHYAGKIQRELHYDSIYHEHLSYFTLKPLEKLFRMNGLFVFDVEKSPISGGALIVYVSKMKKKISPALKRYREMERKEGMNSSAKWKRFAVESTKHRMHMRALLLKAREKGNIVVGWGASARSSTLLNYCGIDSSLISVIADQNPLKQGYFTAGTHIKIMHPDKVMKKKPDIVVLLGWNFAHEITTDLRTRNLVL